ncbi:CRISPR-associated helicase Cas3' [Bifidobacterium cuniculi]|uniref:CRISPR-associated nuclease/helicase Cas3 domain-containing protein n=1 Tax=Bifidobacterium cuniculi TaxID=1688 RepID=A0A087AT77_9BIFI|nr:CRISPR-associated helicase Cas3' [Bifidobacterium cuniculi]KFI61977.1 hypothetical protein BCUN_1818 [Bifidobacterium cuniculi]
MATALSWLGSYGASVIMLSATLPESKREEYMRAYRRGASAVHAIEAFPTSQPAMNNDFGNPIVPGFQESKSPTEKGWRYPLISSVTADGESTTSAEPSGRSSRVELTMLDDDDATLVQKLKQQLQDGGAAVVIRNTVSRAQHTYDVLKEEFGNDMDVMLDHSRFLACDRASKDEDLIKRFGKSSGPEQRNAIVVATQVVEQSLDVDFDVMISDIAPVDLLLQRMGRLHRHHRGQDEGERPESLRQARLYITGIEQCSPASPPLFATGIESVYQRFFLMRTMAILNIAPGETTMVITPDDIPRLVQTVYDTEHLTCPAAWERETTGERAARDAMLEVRKNSESTAGQFGIFPSWYEKRPFSLGSWLNLDIPDPDGSNNSQSRKSRASVREGDDTFEVLVLQQDDQVTIPSRNLPSVVFSSPSCMARSDIP